MKISREHCDDGGNGQCDDRGMEQSDENWLGALLSKSPWNTVMTRGVEHCDERGHGAL